MSEKYQSILAKLLRWQEAMMDMEEYMEQFSDLIGVSPEAPLQSSVYGLAGAYTREVIESIGCADDDFLVSWWTEHRFGERPMSAGLIGEPMREIDSVESLARFLADCLEREQEDG